ncbi:MAG: hypothetical protein IIA14_04800 [SAR324 cluster bacterium]|nr:hypothetical protein [SAR324 cluster bacterium]
MFCNNKELLSRLIVENPAAVKGEDWQAHLRECSECRREWEAYAKSLAIFLQLEKERDAQFTFRLSWEDLSHSVSRRGFWVRRMGLGRGMLAASAAAAVVVALGVGLWSAPALRTPDTTVAEGEPVRSEAGSKSRTLPANSFRFVVDERGRTLVKERPRITRSLIFTVEAPPRVPVYEVLPVSGGLNSSPATPGFSQQWPQSPTPDFATFRTDRTISGIPVIFENRPSAGPVP